MIQNFAKYFTMLVYVTLNSVTVQIRPIFIYSPLFAGYNAVSYIWKCVQIFVENGYLHSGPVVTQL